MLTGCDPSHVAFYTFNSARLISPLYDEVLFGDVWERTELSKRERSLVTVSALIGMNCPDQLRVHFLRGRAKMA